MNQVLATQSSPNESIQTTSLGGCLQSARLQRKLTLEDIANKTFIKRHYLEALESGDFQLLPAPVYTSGYIRQYARILGIEESSLIQKYQQQRQENSEQTTNGTTSLHQFAPVVSQEDGRVKIDTLQVPPVKEKPAQEMDNNMTQRANGLNTSQVSDSVEGSRKEALVMRYQTEQFADQVFQHLEDEINKTLTIIQNGRSYLQQRLNTYQH